MWQILVVDSDQCTGCEICENVCSITHYEVFNPKFSRIHRVRVEPIINTTIACLRCNNPECVEACEVGALSQNPLTGTIEINDDLCDGCGACVRACPFGAMTVHPEIKKAITCDLCTSVEENTPQCVRYCPKSAIHILDIESNNEEDRQITLANFVKKGFPQPKDANKNTMRAEHREFT
jgi:anaerobic carbon-monoxide dehydrogenase iron sulfur subunit